MVRVGLTGGLGAGKSTVARMLAARGAIVLSSDEIARALMQPRQPVYAGIVERFGLDVVRADGTLDRGMLARLCFEQGRVEEMEAIVHPAVIARQEEMIRAMPESAIVVVESALLFETKFGPGWRERFDRVVLVMASEAVKVARFLARSGATEETRAGLEVEARRRLGAQMPDAAKVGWCDFVVVNGATERELEGRVERIWKELLVLSETSCCST